MAGVSLDPVKKLGNKITPVVNDVERVRRSFMALCEPLHDVFTWANQVTKKRLTEFEEDPQYGWIKTHNTRAFAHYRLGGRDLGPWKLCGNHARSGELWLTDGSYSTRVLHTLSERDVPPPGRNPARIAYYHNPPLGILEPLFGPANDRLLTLWRVDPKTGVPGFRVVRPIGDWKFGGLAKTDLDFILPQTAEDLANLRFQPTDEGLELQIPDEKEGGTQDAGGSAG
jgi:hypothetical protein